MTERPVALVTGASRGVGAAVARALAPTHDLLLGGRDRAALDAVCAELPGARPWPVELTSVTASDVAGFDRLDLLVHSAGVVRIGEVGEAPVEDWRWTFEVNLFAVTELTRLLLPALRAARGQVVLINSTSGQRVNPGWGAYAASKFALRAFADALRLEEHSNGVRVATIYPGRIATDMQKDVREQEGGDYEAARYIAPESVAKAVLAAATATPDAQITEITIRPSGFPPV
ncbi:SDR family oxidoreductase [Microtetraspora malaysiensis]|uniref:SDR family oxidoreductase n=1 Tax=Microtetraspora malaysiensis TaxID=161358 RepID=A0ABW6SRE3_9ACTN